MKVRPLQHGPGPLELIEEAFHLLRRAPGATFAACFIGTTPFVLGLLYFWSDMARGADAAGRLPSGALALALLFLWMKTWQSIFAQRLLAQLTGATDARWDFARLARTFLAQAIVQPFGLFLLPLALVATLPFAWTFAFFQNATVLGHGAGGAMKDLLQRAGRLCRPWPLQNHYALSTFFLFGLFVFLNVGMGLAAIPLLMKMLLGLETAFTQGGWAMVNTTFLAAVAGLAWLCVDPVVKAFYVLRCFYGESLQTGQDLQAALRRLSSARALAAVAAILLCLAAPASLRAAGAAPPPSPVPPPELNRSIEETLQRREFAWRAPREKPLPADETQGWLAAFMASVTDSLKRAARTVFGWIRDLLIWIFRPRGGGSSWLPASLDWVSVVKLLVVVLLAALLGVIGWLLYKLWRRRSSATPDIAAEALAPAPDLADENTAADQLPEDGWLKLARELIDQGELRLALRAYYLASLAHLADRQLLTIARFKSNRDYERELTRRGHALPALLPPFAENVSVFDRAWYGLHEVTGEMLARFAGNVEALKR